MYEELIRRLREEPLDSNKAALPIMDLCIDAATAIENLSHRLDMAQGERDAVTRHMIELEQDVCRLKSRLAAYEDTGMEPEEIERIVDAYGRGHTLRTESAERLEIVREIKTDRLRELMQAEQDGRLVVLLCKDSDKLYVVGEKRIIRCDICETYLDDKKGPEYLVSFDCDSDCDGCPFNNWSQDYSGEWSCDGEYGDGCVLGSDFGKTVFLTREEAEAAMAQEGGTHEDSGGL